MIKIYYFLAEFPYWLHHPYFNLGIKSIALAADVSKPKDVQRIVDTIVARWGTVDIACNNAGINMNSASEDTSLEEWDKTFNVNLRGLFLCCQVSMKCCTGLFCKWAMIFIFTLTSNTFYFFLTNFHNKIDVSFNEVTERLVLCQLKTSINIFKSSW